MALTTKELWMDFHNQNITRLCVVQNEKDTRKYNVHFCDEGIPIQLNSNYELMIAQKKPDGNKILKNCKINSDGTGLLEFDENMCIVAGSAAMQFILRDKRDESWTRSIAFNVRIHEAVLDNGDITSSTEFEVLSKLIIKVEELDKLVTQNEKIRQANEEIRKSNEVKRINSETERINNENTRKTKENERTSNEITRINSESERKIKENERISNEITRINSESERKIKENERISNEITRINSESERKTKENERISNENIRKTQEAKRQTDTATAIINTNNAAKNANEKANDLQNKLDNNYFVLTNELENSVNSTSKTHAPTANAVKIAYDKSISVENTINSNKNNWNDKYTKNEIDNKFSTLENNIDWKESVATYADIVKTYPKPEDGWTVNVKDTDYTYRYSGSKWVAISANAIPKATQSVDGLLSKEDKINYDDTNSKKHTHSNKSILDNITSNFINTWNRVTDKLDKTGDASNVTNTITTASTRTNLTTGEKLSISLGKIAKWFSDLKTVAFTGSYNNLSDKPNIGNGLITIKQSGVSKGTFTMNQSGNTTIELTDNNINYSAGKNISLSGTQFKLADVCAIVTNWNDVITTGFYMASGASNAPVSGAAWFYGIVIAHNTNYVRQILYRFATDNSVSNGNCDRYERVKHNGTWGIWINTSVRVAVPNNAKFTDTTYPFYQKTISAGFIDNFRTQTKGSSTNGDYLSIIRCDSSVDNAPIYGSGLAWGKNDTHGYLYTDYATETAYIGGGNAGKLKWIKRLALYGQDSTYRKKVVASMVADGKSNYCKLCTLKINSNYRNTPIEIVVQERARTMLSRLYVKFSNSSNNDPELDTFRIIGEHREWYIAKTATSTWVIYGKKSEAWAGINVVDYTGLENINVTWNVENVNTLPSSYIQVSRGGNIDYVCDSNDSRHLTFAYSKNGMALNDTTWLACWNGNELRAINKSNFLSTSGGTITGNVEARNGINFTTGTNSGYGWADWYKGTTKALSIYASTTLCGVIEGRIANYLLIKNPYTIQINANSGYSNIDLFCANLDVFKTSSSTYAPVSASAFNTKSSKYLKENIEKMTEDEANKILDVDVVTFDFKEKFGGEKGCRGVIAEEVYNVIPSVVTAIDKESIDASKNNKDFKFDDITKAPSVDYSKFVPYLIKKIQMQEKDIKKLKERIGM